jgi:HK97 family phage major capsid protein
MRIHNPSADVLALKGIYEKEWHDRFRSIALSGHPVAVDRREEARAAWTASVEQMEDLILQIDRLTADGDEADELVVEALETRFAEAEAEAIRHRANLDRLERIHSARTDFLGEGEGDDESEAEGDDPAVPARAPARRTPPRSAPAARAREGAGGPRLSVRREHLTYERDNGPSFFRDLMMVKANGDFAANDRLHRHMREMLVEERLFLSSTDGTGGDFVPPLWMMDEWTNVIRMGRQFANAVTQRPLPPNTDTISIPRLVTGAATAAQADLGTVQATDPTTGAFNVGVKTVAGQVTLSRQLLDRSQPGMDSILFADLTADYNLRLDQQCLNGGGTGANAKGVFSDASRQQITFTSASPAVASATSADSLYAKLANATQLISTLRGLPPDLIVMHPRRWAWITASVDTATRPLITPVGGRNDLSEPGASNALTQLGAVGNLYGLPVIVDGNIPTNLGAGTNQDAIIVMRTGDTWLMEDQPVKTRVDESIGSASLNVVLQLWNYFAFTTERYSQSIATISGTGLVAPTF